MTLFWALIYNVIFIPVVLLAYGMAMFNRKIRRGLRGRRKTLGRAKKFRERKIDGFGPLFWFHAASHGEFEQARPIIEGLKEVSPDAIIVVSFFSPSGYEACHHPNVDFKFYLPLDFPWVMGSLLRILKPQRIIFASYDIWPNLIWACRRAGIPTILFAARIPMHSTKQWPVLRGFYRTIYNAMHAIYTVAQGDGDRLRSILGRNSGTEVKILGNPRYDRVMDRRNDEPRKTMRTGHTLVVGSAHAEDDPIILQPIIKLLRRSREFRVIWAPHEPASETVTKIGQRFTEAGIAWARYGRRKGRFRKAQVLIVDSVGYLAELYYRGAVAYVGGGFGTHVHNVMEPAIARVPVIFGPKYDRSDEAEQLLAAGGGVVVTGPEQFGERLDQFFTDPGVRDAAGLAAFKVIEDNLWAATRILQAIIGD